MRPSEQASDSVAGRAAPLLRHSCEWCRVPLAGKQAKWCSDACRFRAWDREHPRQRALPLTPPPAPVPPVRDGRALVADRERLVGHNLRVLDRLKEGPATNVELAELLGPAAAWRTRVSDCRLWLEAHEGLTIKAEQVKGGRWNYRLEAIRAIAESDGDLPLQDVGRHLGLGRFLVGARS